MDFSKLHTSKALKVSNKLGINHYNGSITICAWPGTYPTPSPSKCAIEVSIYLEVYQCPQLSKTLSYTFQEGRVPGLVYIGKSPLQEILVPNRDIKVQISVV